MGGSSLFGTAGKGSQVPSRGAGESALGQIVNQIMQEAGPVRREVLSQTLEALQTGGIGARLPVAQRGVEASRAATSSALEQLRAGAAVSGGRGSSAERVLEAQTLLSGEQATAAIPQDIAMQFIGVAPSLTTGLTGQAIQGAGAQGGLFNQRQGFGV